MTVRACLECNQRFSQHEQYAIALLAQIGSSPALTSKVVSGGIVDRAFARRPAFEQRFIDRMRIDETDRVFIEPETERLDLVFGKVVVGLYWLRYARARDLDDLGPTGIRAYNIDDRAVPPAVFMAAYSERFRPKRWSVVQPNVFEYMFANQIDGRLGCIINWHNTLWITCIVPRPGTRTFRRRYPGQEELPFAPN